MPKPWTPFRHATALRFRGAAHAIREAAHMLDPGLAGRVHADYQMQRATLAARLDARLSGATSPPRAVRAAARSVRARYDAARKAIGASLESDRRIVASATELTTLFDRLVGGEPGSCINAVATVAGRWADPNATMATAEAAVMRAHQRSRDDALKHLAEEADESVHRQRPLPVRLVRNGFNTLIGGGLLWRGWLWVSEHWPQIAAHLHH